MHIWAWFGELIDERDFIGMAGVPARLKSRDILAWKDLHGRHLEAWELDAIKQLDKAWLTARLAELAAK